MARLDRDEVRDVLWIAGAALTAAVLPLLTMVGRNLEYEYALFATVLTVALIPLVALVIPGSVARRWAAYPWWVAIGWVVLVGPLVFTMPANVLFWTKICRCSSLSFWLWMAILWAPAWVLSHAAALLMTRGRQFGLNRWRMGAAVAASLVAVAALAGAELWFAPQKRVVSLLFGFLHGPIYDLWIPLDAGVLISRAAHLFIGATFLSLVWWRPVRLNRVLTWTLAGCAMAALVLAAFFPSVGSGIARLRSLMPATLSGDGFTLHYVAPPPPENQAPATIRRLFRDAQFHTSELRKTFGDRAASHVDIFVYPDRNAKKLWFGGGSTDVTDVVTPSVHIVAEPGIHRSLRHELVHAIASRQGFYGLGFHPSMAFTEGLAEALAPSERLVSADDGVAAMIESKRLPDMSSLFSPFFWAESGNRAYTAAGSFVAYLMERFGIGPVLDLYAGKGWGTAIKEDRQKVVDAWKASVLKGFNRERYEMSAEALYRYPGLLADRCPHTKADFQRDKSESPLVRLRQPVGWHPDVHYWKWRTRLDPTDSRAWLLRVDRDVRRLIKDGGRAKENIVSWRGVLQKMRRWPPKTIEDIESMIMESDLARLEGDRAGSMTLLRQAMTDTNGRDIGDDLERQILARLRVERDLGEREGAPWRLYLAGWRGTPPPKGRDREPWLLTYLRLRSGQQDMVASSSLSKMLFLDPDTSLSQSFVFEWYRMLGTSLLESDSFAMSASAWRKALARAPGPMKPFVKEQARRAEFYARAGKWK